MNKFIARQPIFDTRQKVVAYELLFRSGPENFFSAPDADVASAQLIDDSLHVFGIDTLVGNTKAFINLTRKVLLDDLISMIPPARAVAEILETVVVDEEVIEAAKALRKAGYQLALDDFVTRPDNEPLLEIADIVKVDFMAVTGEERKLLVRSLVARKVAVLAEKVETAEDVREATELGCTYFQGYFFCRPEMSARKDIPGLKINYLRLLRELSRPELDFTGIERLLKTDISLASKLLKHLNSAWFGWRQQVTSLRHALVLLGVAQFRKWASLVAVAKMSDDRPMELATTSLIRARFCELLAPLAHEQKHELDAFLVGMFSLVDTIVGRPLEEVLREIAVPPAVATALLEGKSKLAKIFQLAVAMERGEWESVTALCAELKIDEPKLPDLHQKSIRWVSEILGTVA